MDWLDNGSSALICQSLFSSSLTEARPLRALPPAGYPVATRGAGAAAPECPSTQIRPAVRPNRSRFHPLHLALPALAVGVLACGGDRGEFHAELSGGARGEFEGSAVFCSEDRGYGPVLVIQLAGEGVEASFDRPDAALPAARAYPFVPNGEAEPADGFHATVTGISGGEGVELDLSPRGGEIRFAEAGSTRLRGEFRLRGVLENSAAPRAGAARADTLALLAGTFTARGVPCDSIAP